MPPSGTQVPEQRARGVRILVVGEGGKRRSASWSEKHARSDGMLVSEDLARSLAHEHLARHVLPEGEHDVHVVFFDHDEEMGRYLFRAARQDDGTVTVV